MSWASIAKLSSHQRVLLAGKVDGVSVSLENDEDRYLQESLIYIVGAKDQYASMRMPLGPTPVRSDKSHLAAFGGEKRTNSTTCRLARHAVAVGTYGLHVLSLDETKGSHSGEAVLAIRRLVCSCLHTRPPQEQCKHGDHTATSHWIENQNS